MLENIIGNKSIKNSFTFSLKKGKFKDREYEASLYASCLNPLCTCQDLKVEIWSNNDNTQEDQLFLFYINLEKKKISPDFIMEISSESMEFGRAFIKEIEPEDWLALGQFLLALKMDIHRHTSLKELEVEFDNDLIEKHSMIPWLEIFPYAEQTIKDNRNSKYLLDDQYCVRSDCRCTETALSFIKIENKKATKKRHPACYFDYIKNTIKPLNSPITGEMREIITKYGAELKTEYKKRHEVLRKLYRDYRERVGLTNMKTVSHTSQPGRNDPCLCGSGKKYKKCCMS